MAIINGRIDFEDQMYNKKTSVSKGTDIFTLGGDFFTVKTNLSDRKIRDTSMYLENFSDPVTLDNLNVATNNVELTLSDFNGIKLNFDRTETTNHSYFGSLKDKFKFSITNIVDKFPASLYINNEYNEVLLTILNYNYDPASNRTSFKVPVNAITNNFNLKIYQSDNIFLNTNDGIKNLTNSYNKYSLWNFENEYPVLSFTGATLVDNYIHLVVLGNPYPNINSSALKTFHIKPNYENYVNFLSGLDDFESYLLSRDSTPKYTSIFKVPNEDAEGNTILVEEKFTWMTKDGYNLDYNTYEFNLYLDSLMSLATSMDDYKTNLISRFLTTSALKEFDTEDQRTDKLLRLYGKEFDDIKQYIDGLANLTKVTYDKKDNMPDILVKNFARTLGWGTFSTVTEDDLIKSFLGKESNIIMSGQTKNLTPVETDIELWRRMIMNSAYLFKSKGTRDCIDFLFKIIGAPKSLVDFNEYVYVVEDKIDVSNIVVTEETNYPFDSEGYPKPVKNSEEYYFQMKGGWVSNREFAPTNVKNYLSVIGVHTGEYDGGSSYFDAFTDFDGVKGFSFRRVSDNVKSWRENSTEHINNNKSTNYTARDRRLILNSKEASVFMNPARAVEIDVHEYNKMTGKVINLTGLTYPYPDNENTRRDVSKMTFLEYSDFIYSNFINVKNRKVINTFGNGYPTLKKIYEDYLIATDSKALSTSKILKYIDQLGDFWINLIEQFVPSTTIWQGGVVYKNTIFDRQKFDYKHGINDGSEFEREFIPNPNVTINLGRAQGVASLSHSGVISDIAKAISTFSTSLEFPYNPSGPIVETADRNILRVKPFFTSESMLVLEPCLRMEKVSKIILGNVAPIIHNMSVGNKEVDFIFNCNTEFFETGGIFRYNIYKYNSLNQRFSTGLIYSESFSNITPIDGIVNINEVINNEFSDGDYLIKPAFKYEIDLNENRYAGFKVYFAQLKALALPYPKGYSIANDILSIDTYDVNRVGEYGIYDEASDYWFNIISNPYKPVIKFGNLVGLPEKEIILINRVIPVSVNNQTVFYLNEIPSGDIILNVNGITLTKSKQSDFSDDGEYYCKVVSNSNYEIKINPQIHLLTSDVFSVMYMRGNGELSFDSFHETIANITSGTTIPNGLLFNIDTNKYEYYLPFTLNVDVNYSELVVILNGSKLSKVGDYNMDALTPNKIIFTGEIAVADTLLFFYPSNTSKFYLTTKEFTALWEVPNDDKTGKYIVEVSETPDFNTIIMTKSINYRTSALLAINDYTLFVGNFIIPDKKYYYRVKSEKNNINLLGENTVTTIYSETAYFLTDSRVLL